MKRCSNCGSKKSLADFHKDTQAPDGKSYHCKTCVCERATKHRAENIDRIRAYDRLRSKNHRHSPEWVKKHKKEHREKWLARYAVENAVRYKKIKRPKKCSRCGKKSRIYAHHEDYSKRLDIIWLCQLCHMARHKEIKNAS